MKRNSSHADAAIAAGWSRSLRSLRTGSRAPSLKDGSLLDIILRLKEIRPKTWEGTIGTLTAFYRG